MKPVNSFDLFQLSFAPSEIIIEGGQYFYRSRSTTSP